jgi:hypothetical protein
MATDSRSNCALHLLWVDCWCTLHGCNQVFQQVTRQINIKLYTVQIKSNVCTALTQLPKAKSCSKNHPNNWHRTHGDSYSECSPCLGTESWSMATALQAIDSRERKSLSPADKLLTIINVHGVGPSTTRAALQLWRQHASDNADVSAGGAVAERTLSHRKSVNMARRVTPHHEIPFIRVATSQDAWYATVWVQLVNLQQKVAGRKVLDEIFEQTRSINSFNSEVCRVWITMHDKWSINS